MLVTGARRQSALELIEAACGRADPQALEALWTAVPEQMRLLRFAPDTVPPQYAGAFCHDGTWRAVVDLSHLPEPMRREVAWCIFRIINLGGTIPTPALSMLVRRLGEVIAGQPGRAPVSLLGMAGRDWCQQIQHAAHRRTGRLPASATMTGIRALRQRNLRKAESLLRGEITHFAGRPEDHARVLTCQATIQLAVLLTETEPQPSAEISRAGRSGRRSTTCARHPCPGRPASASTSARRRRDPRRIQPYESGH
jgi:hypothetical protein